MRILLACGQEGLLEYRDAWRALPCPLPCPTHLAVRPGGLAVADNTRRQLWTGGTPFPADSGLEAMALWQSCVLTLSGDADCLTMTDAATGVPLLLTRAGVYPQDFCFVDAVTVAVCGGSDGKIRLIRLPELAAVREYDLPSATQRIACSGGVLTVLCLCAEETVCTLMYRLRLTDGRAAQVCAMAGLPGALCPDGRGGVWVSVSERLMHFPPCSHAPDLVIGEFGLIRHMVRVADGVLVSDPVLGICAVADRAGHVRVLHRGDVHQIAVTE